MKTKRVVRKPCACWNTQTRYGTFLRVWNQKWTGISKFRGQSAFSTCDVCSELKAQFNDKTLSINVRLGALKLYRKHLLSQYADRCGFWSLRDVSSDLMSRTLVMTTDGADQAKYAVPRHPTLRACCRSSKLRRPRLKLHGVWSFGYGIRISVLEETTHHGASLVVELLAASLEHVVQTCRSKNLPPPHTLVRVGDNTVKEMKNSIVFGYLSSLIKNRKLELPYFVEQTFVDLVLKPEK